MKFNQEALFRAAEARALTASILEARLDHRRRSGMTTTSHGPIPPPTSWEDGPYIVINNMVASVDREEMAAFLDGPTECQEAS